MKNIIVLGGSGYVGTHLLETWLKRDSELNIFSLSRRGRPQKLSSYLANNDRVQWFAVDIFDTDSYLAKLPTQVEVIVNLVGNADAKSPELFEQINVEPLKAMFELMDRLSIPKGCFISGVIGMPFKNKPYVDSKQKAEKLIKESGRNISILKPSLIYGDKPEVAAIVPCISLFSKIPGKSKYKPIHVNKLASEIVEACTRQEEV